MIKRILLTQSLILCALTAAAAPLKRADVAADPGLVVHFDLDGLRATSVGKALLAQMNQPEVDTKLSALKTIFGFDPRTELHGATIYTKSQTPQEGVLIIYADFDPERVVGLGKLAQGFHTITNGSHSIYSWIDEKEEAKNAENPHIYAAIQGNRVVVGKAEAPLVAALNVLDGNAPSLAGEKSLTELGAAGEGNFIQAVARKLEFEDKDPNAAIFKMSKLIRLEAGETGDHLAATLSMQAKDADVATQISAIVQGLLALLKLQQGNPDILKLANAISLHQDGDTVTASISISSKDAVDLIKTKAAENEKKKSGDTNSVPPQ